MVESTTGFTDSKFVQYKAERSKSPNNMDKLELCPNENGSGVILKVSGGSGITFQSAEYLAYQSLFKLLDTGDYGQLSIHSLAFLDTLKRTQIEAKKMNQLLSIVFRNTVSEGEDQTVISLHQWLMLCKLITLSQNDINFVADEGAFNKLLDDTEVIIDYASIPNDPELDFDFTPESKAVANFSVGSVEYLLNCESYRLGMKAVVEGTEISESIGYEQPHVRYKLRSEVFVFSTRGDARSPEKFVTYNVTRRYSDFVMLVGLLNKFYKGIVVPPLPPKLWPFSNTEVTTNERSLQLQLFLNAILCHPLLKHVLEVRLFLSASNKGFKAFADLFPLLAVKGAGGGHSPTESTTAAVTTKVKEAASTIWDTLSTVGSVLTSTVMLQSSTAAVTTTTSSSVGVSNGVPTTGIPNATAPHGTFVSSSPGSSFGGAIDGLLQWGEKLIADNATTFQSANSLGPPKLTRGNAGGSDSVVSLSPQQTVQNLEYYSHMVQRLEYLTACESSKMYELSQLGYFLDQLSGAEGRYLPGIVTEDTKHWVEARTTLSLQQTCKAVEKIAAAATAVQQEQYLQVLVPAQFIARYLGAVRNVMAQRQQARESVEQLTSLKTERKREFDQARSVKGATELMLSKHSLQLQAAEDALDEAAKNEKLLSQVMSGELTMAEDITRYGIESQLKALALAQVKAHRQRRKYWEDLRDELMATTLPCSSSTTASPSFFPAPNYLNDKNSQNL